MEKEFQVGIDGFKLNEFISKGSLDFDAWTSLISEIEEAYPEDIEKICLVYDSFLSEFPLCYVYWRKYADHKARLCTVDKVIEVFERAVQSATHSVGVWVDYCSFSMSVFEDPVDVRRLFRRGLSFVGKDYLCHTLWDKYIEFEFSQQQWISLAHIYIQTLKFPTKKLHHYYDSFKKLTAIWEERIECQRSSAMEEQSELVLDTEVTTCYDDDEILQVIKDLLDPSIGSFRSKVLQKYLFTGEQLYREACRLDTKIKSFETQIRRPYFHVKPLDDDQLENWHHYLDFVEVQWDFDWAVKLYERCLIPCANYPEFWMRYVEYMESKGGREIANFALDRATKNYLKSVPAIHLFNAQFKEKIGDVFGARAAFLECDTDLDTNFVQHVIKEANMEKRLGNFVAASNIYEEALELAAMNQKLHTLPILYVHFSRLKFMISGRVDAAIDVLIDGIEQVPHCKLLLEELINFAMMHGGPRHIKAIDSMVANAISAGPDISQGFSSKDIEDISSLYLEFVDFCGSIHDVRKAWNRHIRLFSHSLRATSSYKHTATCRKPLNKATEKRNENVICLPTLKQELSLPENHRIESNQDITEQPQSEANNISLEKLQHVSPIVPEQSTEDASEPTLSTVLLHHRDGIESAQASPEYSEANDIQPEHGREMEQDLKPLTLESLSLNSLDNKSLDSIPSTSYEFAVPQTTCISIGGALESNCDTNGSPFDPSLISTRPADSPEKLNESIPEGGQTNVNLCTSSPTGTPTANPPQMLSESIVDGGQNINGNTSISSPRDTLAADSSQIQTEPVMPSSSASPKLTEALSQTQVPSDDQQHLQKQVSQEQYPQAQMGAQKLVSEATSSQHLSRQIPNVQMGSEVENHSQAADILGTPPATHVWPMQNVQQQNFAFPLVTQPVSYPQSQICQYPMQSIDQSGLLQSGQAYNQMWQYYYYQQQQQLLVQQQYYLQQQQEQLQQQLLQQPQTHPQQQQLLQQYQQLQLQQQHNYLQQQQLQPPPFQQQHQSLLQQQPPNQQQYQQQLQQQQQVLYFQQQQDQHQQYLQILQQQQQVILQQQPHQQQQEQEQHQQQITQMWNNNLYSQQASLQYYDSSSASGMEASQQVVATQGQGSQTTTHASHPASSPQSQQQSSQNQ